MERRNFLIGMAVASAAGGILIGSGTFSRVESDRCVRIAVAEDPDAYLGLDACDSIHGDNYVDLDDDGHLYVDISENPNGGEGVNSNSRTWFDDVFQVCNQGKETVYVSVERGDDWPTVDAGEYAGDPRVDFYLGDDEASILGAENAMALEVGECDFVGVKTNTHGVNATDVDSLLEELDDVVTIVADTDPEEEPPVGTAFFEVSDIDPMEITVERGEPFTVSATVTNTGDAADEQTVELELNPVLAEQTVSLEPDESEVVTFEDVPTDDLDEGEYTVTISSDDDEATGGSVTVATEDDDASNTLIVGAFDPSETIELGGVQTGRVGVAPESIEDVENPTLVLEAGEEYTLVWENLDGPSHNFAIEDEDGEDLLATDFVSGMGETQTVEFEATGEMAEYYCLPHPGTMRGEVRIG